MDTGRRYREQEQLAKRAKLYDAFGKIRYVAGVDCSYAGDRIIGGVVVVDYASLRPVERVCAIRKLKFPYIPGLLAYREAGAMIAAFRKAKTDIDILMVDGFGTNHPRRCGIATHVGLALDVPTIGVGKSFLCGDACEGYICQSGERTGKMVYSAGAKRPVYVSPGHKISLDTAVEVVEHCIRTGRQPEPTRLAHEYVSLIKQTLIGEPIKPRHPGATRRPCRAARPSMRRAFRSAGRGGIASRLRVFIDLRKNGHF